MPSAKSRARSQPARSARPRLRSRRDAWTKSSAATTAAATGSTSLIVPGCGALGRHVAPCNFRACTYDPTVVNAGGAGNGASVRGTHGTGWRGAWACLGGVAAAGAVAAVLASAGAAAGRVPLPPVVLAHVGEQRLDSQLVQVADSARSHGSAAAVASAKAQSLDVSHGMVRVIVQARPGQVVTAEIRGRCARRPGRGAGRRPRAGARRAGSVAAARLERRRRECCAPGCAGCAVGGRGCPGDRCGRVADGRRTTGRG